MAQSPWDFSAPLDQLADSAHQGSAKEVREGTYTWQCEDIVETKTQVGDAKIEVKLSIVSQDDGKSDLVGVARKQHFVIGHHKAEVAASYQKAFFAYLRASGIDLATVTDEDALFLAIRKVKKTQAKVRYSVKPQEKDPKYLDWVLASSPTLVTEVIVANAPAPVAQAPVAQAPAPVARQDDSLFEDMPF